MTTIKIKIPQRSVSPPIRNYRKVSAGFVETNPDTGVQRLILKESPEYNRVVTRVANNSSSVYRRLNK